VPERLAIKLQFNSSLKAGCIYTIRKYTCSLIHTGHVCSMARFIEIWEMMERLAGDEPTNYRWGHGGASPTNFVEGRQGSLICDSDAKGKNFKPVGPDAGTVITQAYI
jgi:hypothetical protein